MPEKIQLALIIVLIIALYIVSSRWQPAQRSLRISFWIGLAVALVLAIVLLLLTKHAVSGA
jgi:multisubunit Na+/H+ antiporter MnhB subunit